MIFFFLLYLCNKVFSRIGRFVGIQQGCAMSTSSVALIAQPSGLSSTHASVHSTGLGYKYVTFIYKPLSKTLPKQQTYKTMTSTISPKISPFACTQKYSLLTYMFTSFALYISQQFCLYTFNNGLQVHPLSWCSYLFCDSLNETAWFLCYLLP